jgi:acid phosphatase (class A)
MSDPTPRARRVLLLVCGCALVALPAPLPAAENLMQARATPGTAPATLHFARLEALDFLALVPAPPPRDTLAAAAELETVRQAEAWRTAPEIAWAQRIERDQVFYHADVLGAWFTPENLPLTAAFFKTLGEDLRVLDGAAKKPFLRPRPSTVDPTLRPCVTVPASTSYPSGSAMQAFVWAELLAEAVPAKNAALLERAARAAWGRVIGGVHYPADLVAGRTVGEAYLALARKNELFRARWEEARREISAAAAAAATPPPAAGSPSRAKAP